MTKVKNSLKTVFFETTVNSKITKKKKKPEYPLYLGTQVSGSAEKSQKIIDDIVEAHKKELEDVLSPYSLN